MDIIKKTTSLILAIVIIFINYTVVFATEPAKPIPHYFRRQDYRDRILTIINSQIGYKEDSEGSTVYHQELFKGVKPGDQYYNTDWCSIFIAWCFKKAGMYNAVFGEIAAASAKNLAYRFMTGGVSEKKQGISLAFFDAEYISKVKPGDIVFYNWQREPVDDFTDIANINKISHAGFVVAVNEDGSLQVVEGNFKNEVWTGLLSKDNKRHNPEKIAGFGVFDAMPEKERYAYKPILAAKINTGKSFLIYFIYKDGSCLTSNGNHQIKDFMFDLPNNLAFVKAEGDFDLFLDTSLKTNLGKIAKGDKYAVLGEENGVKQIIYPSSLVENSRIFAIYKTAFIKP